MPRTESIFSHAAKAVAASLALNEFSASLLFVSRTHSKTAPHAPEMFKSSSSAAVNDGNRLAAEFSSGIFFERQHFRRAFAQLADAFVNARQRRLRTSQTIEREIKSLAVMRGEQQIAHFAAGETFGLQIAQGEKISERLAHFFPFDE